jgi:hypothetical protein
MLHVRSVDSPGWTFLPLSPRQPGECLQTLGFLRSLLTSMESIHRTAAVANQGTSFRPCSRTIWPVKSATAAMEMRIQTRLFTLEVERPVRIGVPSVEVVDDLGYGRS